MHAQINRLSVFLHHLISFLLNTRLIEAFYFQKKNSLQSEINLFVALVNIHACFQNQSFEFIYGTHFDFCLFSSHTGFYFENWRDWNYFALLGIKINRSQTINLLTALQIIWMPIDYCAGRLSLVSTCRGGILNLTHFVGFFCHWFDLWWQFCFEK